LVEKVPVAMTWTVCCCLCTPCAPERGVGFLSLNSAHACDCQTSWTSNQVRCTLQEDMRCCVREMNTRSSNLGGPCHASGSLWPRRVRALYLKPSSLHFQCLENGWASHGIGQTLFAVPILIGSSSSIIEFRRNLVSIEILHEIVDSSSSISLPLVLWHTSSCLCDVVSIIRGRILLSDHTFDSHQLTHHLFHAFNLQSTSFILISLNVRI